MSFSSDTPGGEPDWLQGIEAAVLRKSKASGTVRGRPSGSRAREAIRVYTMGGAWQDHMERRKGSLEPGKLADFCVLEQDILSVARGDPRHQERGHGGGGRRVYEAGL